LTGVIMVPTRELAFQTYQWVRYFAGVAGEGEIDKVIQVLVNDGEHNNAQQMRLLEAVTPRIIVGTAHRLEGLALEGKLPSLFRVERVLVDEVDKVLGALTSHAPQKKVLNRELHPKPGAVVLDYLLENARNKYQTVVASATANAATRSLLMQRKWVKNPVRIQLCEDDVSIPSTLTHRFVFMEAEGDRIELLKRLAKDPSFTAG